MIIFAGRESVKINSRTFGGDIIIRTSDERWKIMETYGVDGEFDCASIHVEYKKFNHPMLILEAVFLDVFRTSRFLHG